MWFKKRIKEEKLENVPVYDEEPYQGRTFEKFKESQELPDEKTVFLDLVSSFNDEWNSIDSLMDEIESRPVGMDITETRIELISENDIEDFVPDRTIAEMEAVLLHRTDYLYSNWYSVDLDEKYSLEGLIHYNSREKNIEVCLVARTHKRQDAVIRYRDTRTGKVIDV